MSFGAEGWLWLVVLVPAALALLWWAVVWRSNARRRFGAREEHVIASGEREHRVVEREPADAVVAHHGLTSREPMHEAGRMRDRVSSDFIEILRRRVRVLGSDPRCGLGYAGNLCQHDRDGRLSASAAWFDSPSHACVGANEDAAAQ